MAKKISVLEACWALELANYEDGRTFFVGNELGIQAISKYYPCNGRPMLTIQYDGDSEVSWANLRLEDQKRYLEFFYAEGQPFDDRWFNQETGKFKEGFWEALQDGSL